MINSVYIDEQKILKNENVIFDKDEVRTKSSRSPYRGWLYHRVFSDNFILTKPGIYRVNYNANILSSVIDQGFLVLTANDNPIPGTLSINGASKNFGTVSATTLIKVYPYQHLTLRLKNNSEDTMTVKDANIIIEKVA